MLLDDGAEDLEPGGIVPEVFFYSLLKLQRYGCENIIYSPRDIVTVEVADRKKISISAPNTRSCKGLDPLEDFPIFDFSPVIYKVEFILKI